VGAVSLAELDSGRRTVFRGRKNEENFICYLFDKYSWSDPRNPTKWIGLIFSRKKKKNPEIEEGA